METIFFEGGNVLLINKPLGWTSFDAVKKVRNSLGNRKLKVGHAGTLDPLAWGLLVICTGKITEIRLPEVDFKVVCSKGTYIRSLANDFGKALECGGYLASLCRTRIGNYLLADAITPEEFAERQKIACN